MAENLEALAENPKLSQLTIIEKGASKFYSEKSKKWYFVEYDINEIMLKRYEVLERFLLEMNFSMTAEHLTKNIFNAMKMLKENEPNDAYVILHNIVQGITDTRTKHIITMWVCSVFIYREGEDISDWSKQVSLEKIEDWKSSFDTGFFLQLRNRMFSELENTWNIISQAFSEFPKNQQAEEIREQEVQKKFGENQNNEP
jgi:hypothetical protein